MYSRSADNRKAVYDIYVDGEGVFRFTYASAAGAMSTSPTAPAAASLFHELDYGVGTEVIDVDVDETNDSKS